MAPVEVKVDYYAVLEISNTATPEVITKNYRRLARIRHPDKNRNNNDSTAVFQLVSLNTFQT
jgi:curved DNA-binding protein CbpA